MKKLTLSIVIPVHNEEDHIISCLETIAAQTVLPNEIIIVDNNCTDKTIQLARSYDLVRVVKESKPGIAHARNKGFDAVTSDIIGRIDADTRLPETWVEDAITHLQEKPDSLLTGGSYMYDLAFPRFFGWVQEYFAFGINKIIIGSYIAWGSNLVLTKKMWKEVRQSVNNSTDIHEDIDLGLHLNTRGYTVHYNRHRKVGIESRVFSSKRQTRAQHLAYLKMWPNTLYAHKLRRAWLGLIGAYFIYFMFYPLLLVHKFWYSVQNLRAGYERY